MLNKNEKITKYVIYFVIFSIGITLGKLLNWGYFKLVKEISVIDALTLFATIGLAIYVAKIVEKEVQKNRIEKELYIAKITELERLLNDFEIILEEKEILYNKIISRIHSCRIKKNSIFGNIKDNFKQIKIDNIDFLEKEITDKINSLKRLLTETSIVSELFVQKGIANYSPNRTIEIFTAINAINENLFKMKVRINNL
ncbi:MAG: hypothetical protein LBM25_03240 [Bacteroidales bacterium]|jgi:hypothetical protein|nr:hypothetical protein [Bacteroidales bacterium]